MKWITAKRSFGTVTLGSFNLNGINFLIYLIWKCIKLMLRIPSALHSLFNCHCLYLKSILWIEIDTHLLCLSLSSSLELFQMLYTCPPFYFFCTVHHKSKIDANYKFSVNFSMDSSRITYELFDTMHARNNNIMELLMRSRFKRKLGFGDFNLLL